MSEIINEEKFSGEETKSTKLFLWMFYLSFFGYDAFYFFIYPRLNNTRVGLPVGGIGYWFYVLTLSLLPFSIYLLKIKKPYLIKYIYTIAFILIEFTNLLFISFSDPRKVHDGNVVEIFLLLFAPIFINKKYFWTVVFILLGKYLFQTFFFHTAEFLFPIVIILVVGIVTYIFLARFTSYIKTLTTVYEKQRQSERQAILGQMATSIGHEIRNPLSALRGFTQLQQEQDKNENSFYPIMIQEIDRINEIVDDLMILGKPSQLVYEENDFKKIIEYVSTVTNQLAKTYGSQVIVINFDTFQPIECNEKQLKQALINIIKNALEAMQEGGIVKVSVFLKGKDRIQIVVEDAGCGIEPEKLKKLGEPYYTTKPDGTGLGILITKKIIEDHNGEIFYESKKGKGTKVTIIIPIMHSDKK